MEKISIIGLDLAKHVFQVHAADERGQCVQRKQLKRRQVLAFFAKLAPCVVAMERAGRPITGRARSKSLAMRRG